MQPVNVFLVATFSGRRDSGKRGNQTAKSNIAILRVLILLYVYSYKVSGLQPPKRLSVDFFLSCAIDLYFCFCTSTIMS